MSLSKRLFIAAAILAVVAACSNEEPPTLPVQTPTVQDVPSPSDINAQEGAWGAHEQALADAGFKVVKGSMRRTLTTYFNPNGEDMTVQELHVFLDLACPSSKTMQRRFTTPENAAEPYPLIWNRNPTLPSEEVTFTTQPTDEQIRTNKMCE